MSGALDEQAFRAFLQRRTGFEIPDDRWRFLAPRFLSRLAERGFDDVAAYLRYLDEHHRGRTELEEIFNILTVRKTSFFRNPASYAALEQHVLPRLLEGRPAGLPLSVWSAGCASGEEPYSIAMVCEGVLGPLQRSHYVLGTDIVREALNTAEQASYPEVDLAPIPPEYRRFVRLQGGRGSIDPELRQRVDFAIHNLVHDPAPRSATGQWDIVYCRNVLIYFGAEQCRELLRRFTALLAPGGILFLGHAEVFMDLEQDYEVVFWGDTFYYRKRVDPRLEPLRAARPATPIDRTHAAPSSHWRAVPGPDLATRVVRRPSAPPPPPDLAATTTRLGLPASPEPDVARDGPPTRAMLRPTDEGAWERRRQDAPTETLRLRRESPTELRRRVDLDTRSRARLLGEGGTLLPTDQVLQAEHHLQQGDLEAAARTLRAAISRAPRWARPRVVLALVYDRQGQVEDAVRQLETATEVEPLEVRAYFLLGDIHLRKGDLDRAEAALRRALYIEPDHALARHALARVYRQTGRNDRAQRELRNALRSLEQLDPIRVRTLLDRPAAEIAQRCRAELAELERG